MLKIFSQIIRFSSFLFIFITCLIHPSCKNHINSGQIRRLDTIIHWNNNAKDLLIIDVQAIKLRTDSMKIKISTIDTNSFSKTKIQLKSDLVIYNGLLNRYNNFLINYPNIESENSQNSKFLNNLKLELIGNKTLMNNNSLDSLLNSQEIIIQNHFNHTREVVEAIFSVEEMYQRINNRINPVYENQNVLENKQH